MGLGISIPRPISCSRCLWAAILLVDLPAISDFQDRYCGHWDSFDDYASNYADDIGLLTGIPEEIQRHFDWKSWTSELAYDYTTCDAESGLYVFRSY